MSYPNDQGNPAGAIPVYLASPAAGAKTLSDSHSSVDNAAPAVIIPGGTYNGWATVQNTHATQTLYIGFSNSLTSAGVAIAPGLAFTFPFGLANSLYGLGSGAGTTFAIVGY